MLITFLAVATLKWFPASGMRDAYTVPPVFGTDAYWAFVGSDPLYAITRPGASPGAARA